MADVVLIYPYFYTHALTAMLFHPQGIAPLAAVLRGAGVTVTVNGHELQGHGELIMLNEVAGLPFGRLRIGTNIQEGNDISAWQSCPFNTVLENPECGIGFCLALPADAESSHWRLAVGREIGRELNWAGLALTANQRQFSYGISFTDTFNHR